MKIRCLDKERKKVEKQLKRKGKTGLIDMYNGRGQ